MIWIKLTISAVFIGFWIYGGQKSGRMRDVPCPLLIALYCAIILKTWWLFPALVVTYQVIRFGYGGLSEDDTKPSFLASFIRDKGGEWTRMFWGLIVAVLGPLPLVLGHFLGIWQYVGYIALNMIVNYSISKFEFGVYLTDILVAGAVASIIFFV